MGRMLKAGAAAIIAPAAAEAGTILFREEDKAVSNNKEKKTTREETIPRELMGNDSKLDDDNLIALNDGLAPIEDFEKLKELPKTNPLVALPESKVLLVAEKLKSEGRALCCPWTAEFLLQLSKDFSAAFPGGKFYVSSAVRPKNLVLTGNLNASEKSVHPSGNTVDIYYGDLSDEQILWLQKYFIKLRDKKIKENFFEAEIPNPEAMNPNQRRWYANLTQGKRDELSKLPRNEQGNIIYQLPKVNVIQEQANKKCFHIPVAKNYLKVNQPK